MLLSITYFMGTMHLFYENYKIDLPHMQEGQG